MLQPEQPGWRGAHPALLPWEQHFHPPGHGPAEQSPPTAEHRCPGKPEPAGSLSQGRVPCSRVSTSQPRSAGLCSGAEEETGCARRPRCAIRENKGGEGNCARSAAGAGMQLPLPGSQPCFFPSPPYPLVLERGRFPSSCPRGKHRPAQGKFGTFSLKKSSSVQDVVTDETSTLSIRETLGRVPSKAKFPLHSKQDTWKGAAVISKACLFQSGRKLNFRVIYPRTPKWSGSIQLITHQHLLVCF